MCKTRVSVMTQDSRKAFVSILTSLIEKSPDTKLLRMLTKIVEEWVKAKVETCGWSRISLEQLYVCGMLVCKSTTVLPIICGYSTCHIMEGVLR